MQGPLAQAPALCIQRTDDKIRSEPRPLRQHAGQNAFTGETNSHNVAAKASAFGTCVAVTPSTGLVYAALRIFLLRGDI